MLTEKEKEYLFSKLEYRKRKKSIQNQNDIYKSLKGEIDLNQELFIKILNSLEYSFKKKLKEGTMKSPTFLSIQKKLPNEWSGLKYSSLKSKDKKPTIRNTKSEIISYLKRKNIKYDSKSTKKDLISLFVSPDETTS